MVGRTIQLMNEFEKLKHAIEAKRRPGGIHEIRSAFSDFEDIYIVPLSQVLQLLGWWIVLVVQVWS